MPVTPDELVRLLAMLAEDEKLKVTVKETLKGGAMAGTGAVIGGLLGGPIGIAVGGVMGSVAGKWYSKGKFRAVSDILTELTKEQRDQLHSSFYSILSDNSADDFNSLNRKVSTDGELRERILQELRTFITGTLKEVILEENVLRGKAD